MELIVGTNDIDLHDLRCLIVLADELNFGRAAERLHMSQPPLTRLLAEMEKILGAKLFARTTRRVSLTPVGDVFITEARSVLSRFEEAMQNVAAAAQRQSGQIRLAYTPLALQTVLPRLMTAFREQDHDARIDLVEMPGAAQPGALASGRADLAFSDEPAKEAQFESLLLRREPLSLLIPEGHPLAASGKVTLKQLNGQTLILHPRHENPDYYDRTIAAFESSGVSPSIREREPGQNCMALVVSGAGLLLTPASHHQSHSPGIRCAEVETSFPLHAEVWAIWSTAPASDRMAAFIRIIKELKNTDAR
ncbi:MAG: LysR substrate-binding domain-containing protein [Capsulimonas sp.]|uniref:LysR substrate-binding domain-containing protein n=1 Tax=Capsulimonas sp. TaxID=2494211 RepID=UPI003264F2C3